MNRTTIPYPLVPAPAGRPRRALVQLLRLSGRWLLRLARRIRPGRTPSAAEAMDPVLEFYAEAGAPEGALFVDGCRIGVLPGVTRL
ncbi:MAG TPA: hypothetical protein PKD25_14175 [Rubrivivax sp.]|jgi:hypothetical protein|nr:hypothetical protein [Rubrivivax sp.]